MNLPIVFNKKIARRKKFSCKNIKITRFVALTDIFNLRLK